MTAAAKQIITSEEYLEFEKSSSLRHEFVNGKILAMAGEKKRHNRLAFRLAKLLDDAATKHHCQVYLETIKVRTRDNKYRYPDVILTCEENADDYMVFAPCALIEILSDSTEDTDTFEKVEEYLKLESLQRYVILHQDRASAVVYAKDTTGWRVEILEETGTISIPCVEMSLSLEQIYMGLE
jgi:Uma2 family endonuclease